MKIVKKFSVIIFYMFLISVFLQFDMKMLIDARQLLLVFFGAALLYLPNIRLKPKLVIDWEVFGRMALFASQIQTFILLFLLLSETQTIDRLLYDVALECRSLLYGLCIFIILNGAEKGKDNTENIQKEYSIEEYMEVLREKGLTPREIEVAVQVNKGLSNAQIAEKLFITETTVKKHLSNIFAKLGVTRREQIRRVFDKNRGI